MKNLARFFKSARGALFVVCATFASSCAVVDGGVQNAASVSATANAAWTNTTDAGWAGHAEPVTGGALAGKQKTYTVRSRRELVAALAAHDKILAHEAKIIRIEGVIDLSVDDSNLPLTESDYKDPAFSWDKYVAAFSPATWGRSKPEGSQEIARQRSARNQEKVVLVRVGSNTTLVGVGEKAVLKNGSLMLLDIENVIIRNIAFEDAYDYFPAWDPADNGHGEWNAAYDNISVVNSRRVWIDFCTFSDGVRPDRLNRTLLNRPMQFHDGLVDVIRGSDLVTISNSHFRDHDKGLLIGNSDSRKDDAGRLRVTLHNNWFDNVKERSPRVRYGQVHVYNNLYTATKGADYDYGYSIGVGIGSSIFAEANAFILERDGSSRIFRWLRGDRLAARDNVQLIDGQWRTLKVDPPSEEAITSSRATWHVPYPYQLSSASDLTTRLRGHVGAGTTAAREKVANDHKFAFVLNKKPSI